jgi:N-acetylmuramoyl-L-alanine amidase
MRKEASARTRVLLGLIVALAVLSGAASLEAPRARAQAPMPPQAPERQSAAPASPQQPATQVPPSVPGERPGGPPALVIILDPAHGGPDSGAHGDGAEEGAVEKDLVLTIALAMRRDLERQGARVVLTRQTDAEVSINDRAALANGIGGGFFVSLHVGSSGPANTAETYSFGTPHGGAPPAFVPRPLGIDAVRWDDAQSSYAVPSRRFAELLQVELAQKLPRSPDVPQFAAVRQLRVVAHPAVAIELSSVAEEEPEALEKTAGPLASALLRAIAAYRQPAEGRP